MNGNLHSNLPPLQVKLPMLLSKPKKSYKSVSKTDLMTEQEKDQEEEDYHKKAAKDKQEKRSGKVKVTKVKTKTKLIQKAESNIKITYYIKNSSTDKNGIEALISLQA